MSHNIPKIQYGSGPTEIIFDYPPETKGNNTEEIDSVDHTSFAISGKRQTVVDYVQAIRKVVFGHVSETLRAQLETFFTSHAYLGKSFKYFEDQNSISYVSYELKDLKYTPKRIAPVTANVYVYEIPFTFRRVIGEESTDAMTLTIANNQAVAASLAGLTLDSTKGQTYTMDFELVRKTDSSERVARGILRATYHTSTGLWDITPSGAYDGDLHGVTFSMSSNQVKYVSDNQAGTNYVGTLKIKTFTAT